jgi:hypothetical protein
MAKPLQFAAKTKVEKPEQAPAAEQSVASSASDSKPSWLKKGSAAKAALEKETTEAANRTNTTFRFALKPDQEARITFLDGNLIEEGEEKGMLDCPVFREHTVKTGTNKWDNFVCVAEVEPCPLCAQDNTPSVVAAFTVIDHTPRTASNGKTYENQKRLFIAKRLTLKKLQKKATKLGGLAGITFDASRSDAKVARVGDEFDEIEQSTHQELVEKYGEQVCTPVVYDKEIQWRSAAELAANGLGAVPTTIGASTPAAGPFGS